MDRQSCPPCVMDVLSAPKDKLPHNRPHQNRSGPEIKAELKNSITTWHTFTGPKEKIEVKLRELAVEIRWRELEPLKEQLDEYDIMASIPDGPWPQGPRFTRQAQGNTHGARQLQQLQRANKPELATRAASTRIATRGPIQPGSEACRQGSQSSRPCLVCSKVVETDDAADNLEFKVCSLCRQRQTRALEVPRTSGVGLKTFKPAKLRSAAANGGEAAAGSSGAVPRPLSQISFYRAGPGAAGSSNPRLGPSTAHTAPENAVPGISTAGQTGRSKGEQQPQQQSPVNRRKTLDAGDDGTPGKRGAGAAKARGRHPAPVEPEDKEPIDLVDSSDEENKEGAFERDKMHAEAGGPRSAIAGGNFLKLSAQLAGLKCCFPQEGGKSSVEVTAEDLARLENGEFLNDTCIDFYMKYIEHHLPQDIRMRYHFFNSFFLKKLQEKPSSKGGKLSKADRLKQDHERVKKWTKHVDLFSKDFIFVPIHGFLHWSLVLICHPGNVVHNEVLHPPASAEVSTAQGAGGGSPLLLHLDSLAGNHAPKAIFEALRSYMELEWKRKMDDETHDSVPRRWKERFVNAKVENPDVRFTAQTLPGISMSARLPKQDNHTDCGLFLLSYMDFFTAANPRCVVSEGSNAQDVHALDPCADSANMETLLQKHWFRGCNAARLRDHLRALICKLMLERVSPDDERRNTLACVVSDYDSKPHKMGMRYLQPAEYLAYVKERPNEPEPVLEDDVLSDGSDAEGHVEEPKWAVGSPSRTMTRAAAKKAGVQPMDGLRADTGAENKRRKVPEPAVSGGPSSLGADRSVVDLSSPGKAKSASQAATQQAPSGLKKTGSGPEAMDVDGGDADLNVVPRSPGTGLPPEGSPAAAGGGEDRVDEPPAKRTKRQADAATNLAAQGKSIALDNRATALGRTQALGESLGDDREAATLEMPLNADEMEDAEPPKQRPGRRRRAAKLVVPDDTLVGADRAGATAARCSQMAPSSQQDPETLPCSRPPSCALSPYGSAGGPGHARELEMGSRQEDRGLGATGNDPCNPHRADVRAPAVAPAVGKEPGTAPEGLRHGTVSEPSRRSPRPDAAQRASEIVAPTPDGLVPGDDGEGGCNSESPSWISEEAAKLCRYPDPNLASRDSDDDEALQQDVSAPQGQHIARLQPQQPIGSRMGTSWARTMPPGNALPALYRTHIRFSDDGVATTRERVGISADEAGEAPPHPADCTQQSGCGVLRTNCFGGPATEHAPVLRRCSDAGASFTRLNAAAAQMPLRCTADRQTPPRVHDAPHNEQPATAARGDRVDVVDSAGCADAIPMTSAVGAYKTAPTHLAQGSVAHRPVCTALQGRTESVSVGVQTICDGLAPGQEMRAQPPLPVTTHVPEAVGRTAVEGLVSDPPCRLSILDPAGSSAFVIAAARVPHAVAPPSARASASLTPAAQVPPMSARGGPGARTREKDVDADIGANLSYPQSNNPGTAPGAARDKQHSQTGGLEPVDRIQTIPPLEGQFGDDRPLDDEQTHSQHDHQRQRTPEVSRTVAAHQAPSALLRAGQTPAPQQCKSTSPAGIVSHQEPSAPQGSVKGGNKIRQKKLQLQQQVCGSRERRSIPGIPCLTPPVVLKGNSHASQRPSTEPDEANLVQYPRTNNAFESGLVSKSPPHLTDSEDGDPQRAGRQWHHEADQHRMEQHSAERSARDVLQLYAERQPCQRSLLSPHAEVTTTRNGAADATIRTPPVCLPNLELPEGMQTLSSQPQPRPQPHGSHPVLQLNMQAGNGSPEQQQAQRQQGIDGGSLFTDDEKGEGSPMCRRARACSADAGVELPLRENALALPMPAPGTTAMKRNQVAPTEHAHTGIVRFNDVFKNWAVGLPEGLTVMTRMYDRGRVTDVVSCGQVISGTDAAAVGTSSATWKEVYGAADRALKRSEPNAGVKMEVSMANQDGNRNLADNLDAGILSQLAAQGTGVAAQSAQHKQRSDGGAISCPQRTAERKVRDFGSLTDRAPSESAAAAAVEDAATRAAGATVARGTAGSEGCRTGSEAAVPGLAAAILPARSSDHVFGSAGSGGRTDETIIISVDDESEDKQEEVMRDEQERNGHGSAGTAGTTHRQSSGGTGGQPRGSGQGFPNEAVEAVEEVEDSDEEDSVDIVGGVDRKGEDDDDDAGEDSEDAFVEGKETGSGRRRFSGVKTRSPHGKHSVHQHHRDQRRSRGRRGRGGRGRKGGASGIKSPSSTKGVNPSRGGGASGSTDRRDGKHVRRSTLGSDAQAGRIATACVRRAPDPSGLEVKPDFPRKSQTRTAGPQDILCDLTQDDD